jgi:hypothetical protein
MIHKSWNILGSVSDDNLLAASLGICGNFLAIVTRRNSTMMALVLHPWQHLKQDQTLAVLEAELWELWEVNQQI